MKRSFKGLEALQAPSLTKEEAVSIKALASGTANDIQQKLAYETIRKKLCDLYQPEFHYDERVSAFNGGKRWVGLTMTMIVAEPFDKFITTKGETK